MLKHLPEDFGGLSVKVEEGKSGGQLAGDTGKQRAQLNGAG